MPTLAHSPHPCIHRHVLRALASLVLLLAPTACDPGDDLDAEEEDDRLTGDCACAEGTDPTDRSNLKRRGGSGDRGIDVVFEGAEVRDEIAKNPDARFFVDLRGSDRVRFVQDDVPLGFERFLVHWPTMREPIPMTEFAGLLDFELDLTEFTMQSAAGAEDDNVFRVSRSELLECVEACPGDDDDCVSLCS